MGEVAELRRFRFQINIPKGKTIVLFVLHALDRPSALPKRLANYDAHKAFLSDTSPHGVKIVMSGPLTGDDGETMIGSLFLIDAPDRATVVRFNAADPFFKADIWEKVTITGFIRRQG
ncbi:MAG: hypothetical protein JWQ17_5255 [Tardiphaga sp.]|jgi:uncharacterized protein YciI|nr:hypothetical protein [Tardiphaga sp.]